MSVRACRVFSGRGIPVMRKLYSVSYDNSLWVLQFLGSGRCGIRCDEAALSAEVHLASSALRSSSSMRHMPWTNASRSRAPVSRGSHSFLHKGAHQGEISIVRRQFSPDVPQFPTIETRSFPYVLDDMPIEFVFYTNGFIFPVTIALRFTSLLIFGQC